MTMTSREMIRVRTPGRAGILGNPSDGFFGKTLGIPIRNFFAEVVLFEWDRIEILPGAGDRVNFGSMAELINDIEINGYYGGFRLIKAAIKQFYNYLTRETIDLSPNNFTIRYSSNIPRQVGLAGSSAIITSTIKALSEFYDVPISNPIMANYVLWAETEELGISAGLQDRVIQVYNEPLFMDFSEHLMKKQGYGIYESLDPKIFPEFYLAYQAHLTHIDRVHNDIRVRWESGDPKIIDTMKMLAENAQEGVKALKSQDLEKFKQCLDRNFDLRASIYPISERNMKMINLARSFGATAKFPGSGGAIIGTFESEDVFDMLKKEFKKMDCEVVRILF